MGKSRREPYRTVDAHMKPARAELRAAMPGADPIQTHRGMEYSPRAQP